jgi:hypothetical protein
MGKKPLRIKVGDFISQTVIPVIISPMQEKNTATGVVHAIHSNIAVLLLKPHQTRPIAKPLAM